MIRTKLQLTRFDKDGQLAEQKEQWSRSWLKHFFDILYILQNDYVSLAGVKDISSTAREIQYRGIFDAAPTLQIGGPPGNVGVLYTYGDAIQSPLVGEYIGIVVGTNNLAVTPTQDALQAKIAHGEGAGQLLYGGTEVFGLTFANPNGEFTIRRYFTNVAGGAISVVESGIYAPAHIKTTFTPYSFCIARDVFGAVVVNNGEILRVTYIVQITV